MVVNGMKFKFSRLGFVSALGLAAATVGLAVPAVRSQSPSTIAIDGSSTVFPITEAVAEEYQRENPDVRITVGVSGTGGGFKKFCAGETQISDASRPIKESEMEACAANGIEYIELPVAFDALTVVVNPNNNWVDSMTIEQLETIWEPEAQGSIERWNQINSSWPDRELNLYGPGADSGTFDYFTEAVMGDSGESRGDYTASEDDNVLVQGVAGDENALGYFGFAYYIENQDKLKAVAIDDGDPSNGEGAVLPSSETVENGTYVPFSRPLFIYVSKQAAEERPEVQQFVQYYLENAPALVGEVGYVSLPEAAYDAAMSNFEDRKTGTLFAGVEPGLKIEDVLRREVNQ
jgi:phosphate transport system substrate-binding protein